MSRLAAALFPEHPRIGLWAGLFCLLEWHLLWAAVSGMETMLFVWLSLLLVERYLAVKPLAKRQIEVGLEKHSAFAHSPFAALGLGLLGGLLILTRPEGLGLIGLIGLDMAYQSWRQKKELDRSQLLLFYRWLWLAAGVALLLAPYIAFHLWATGLPFPNTFYAKQAEYRPILEHFSLWQRLFGSFGEPVETAQGVFRVIFIGAQLLLLPGLFFYAWLTLKERRTDLLLIWLWWSGFLLLYGLRLPVTYQHGRYEIPAIPWIILLGLWGMAQLLEKIPRRNVALRALSRAWVLSLGVLLLAFTVIGAQAYSRDVRFIESEMVTTAQWLDAQTAPDALIAAHDIGAIGYFTQRPLIDLAGLITPEVIPIIRDEPALLDFITIHQAGYLVTFPSWYPNLTKSTKLIPLYTTQAPWAPQAGGDNMTVYQLKR
jgi:hypothetical protein